MERFKIIGWTPNLTIGRSFQSYRKYYTRAPLKHSNVPINSSAVQIYGANTDVGKTIVSTILCKIGVNSNVHGGLGYIKPVATGPDTTLDNVHISTYVQGIDIKCYQKYSQPWSPTTAARWERQHRAASDQQDLTETEILRLLNKDLNRRDYGRVTIVETFGGPMSPMPNSEAQADFYRSLRLPVVLVGDSRLGGVSSTISAFESLTIRGYDIRALVMFKNEPHENLNDVQAYLRKYRIGTTMPWMFTLPTIPPQDPNPVRDATSMASYYEAIANDPKLSSGLRAVLFGKAGKAPTAESLTSRAVKSIWHPFMQHKNRAAQDLLAIDSAYDDNFTILNPQNERGFEQSQPFDGSASWWTQGVGHGNPVLSLAAAYAAGRYGHVMFAGAIHQPALELAENLLQGLGNPRLQKVFFTDNGSTGIEVGIKMALKASSKRYGFDGQRDSVDIIGLKGSYHGDTIGAMDCSEQSTFNTQTEWYRGRGYWFDYPEVGMKNGKWVVQPPNGMESDFGASETFNDLNDVFAANRDPSKYEQYIDKKLDEEMNVKGRKFGALLMEPVLLGAGGMIFADPLFQRALVNVVRRRDFGTVESETNAKSTELTWQGLPVVFDEVFAGLYRLGRFSAANFLGVYPDISVHAKLLTGGLIPLCLTVASDSIFDAFLGDEKSDALLHGHSYTAHALGCTVANSTLKMMEPIQKKARDQFRARWTKLQQPSAPELDSANANRAVLPADNSVWSFWDPEFVGLLSHQNTVDSVVALGTVLAIRLHDPTGSGYSSNAAVDLQKRLSDPPEGLGISPIHCRVLGNVIYVMTSLTTERGAMRRLQRAIGIGFDIENEVSHVLSYGTNLKGKKGLQHVNHGLGKSLEPDTNGKSNVE